MQYISALSRLIEQFEKLPGVGSKTAQKMAFYIIESDKSVANEFSKALIDAKEKICLCKICQNLSENEICPICLSEKRDKSVICVVERPSDIIAIEKMKDFNGVFHVLHGVISPMGSVGPDELKINELLTRINNDEVKEVIMATNPNVEGQATALYIAKLIKPLGVKVTGIALGVPVGSSLEYADSVTLARAIENRREL